MVERLRQLIRSHETLNCLNDPGVSRQRLPVAFEAVDDQVLSMPLSLC